MIGHNNILCFLKYKYKPFDKKQCISRIILIWILSALFYFVGSNSFLYGIIMAVVHLMFSILFLRLLNKYSTLMISRFLCDGVTSLCLSLIFAFAAYRFFAFRYGSNTIILLVVLLLICLAVAVSWGIVYLLIKKGYYCTETANKEQKIFPFIGVISGIWFARLIFNGEKIPIESNSMLISMVLLVMAIFFSLGSVNLLKIMLSRTIQTNKQSSDG